MPIPLLNRTAKIVADNIEPQFTITPTGGPGVGFKLKRIPIAVDIDPTGPGVGALLSTSAAGNLVSKIPGDRFKRYAKHIKKMPGSIYAGVELMGPIPAPFIGGSVALSDKDKLIQLFRKKRLKKKLKKKAYTLGFI